MKQPITIITIAIAIITAIGCTDDENTIRTLRAHGFTDIQTTGFEPFACSDDDSFKTGFTAKNAAGVRVSGTVCCGLLKSCTVRF